MLKKTCPVCGKIYYTDQNASKYCSKECMLKAKKPKDKPNRTSVCRGCGKTFVSKRRKWYCTEECRMYANGRGKAVCIPKKKKTKPKYSLAQIAAMANAEGITYGKYVTKYNL